jgi:thiol-disulfide isomerase/thioredoxin
MLKKILLLFLGLLFIALLIGIARSVPARPEDGMAAETFPAALLTQHTSWQAPGTAESRVLIFYNPDCEHCQYEAKTLSTHPDFQEMAVVWLSGAPPAENGAFQERYASEAPDAFQFLDDPQYAVANALGIRTFPTILIYGAEGALLKRYEGETKPEAILRWME